MGQDQRAQVIVIGAGVVGLSCAYFLCRRGADVLILERRHPLAGATGATAGLVLTASNHPTPAPLRAMARESPRMIRDIARREGFDPETHSRGILIAGLGRAGREPVRALYRDARDLGIDCRLRDAAWLRRTEPALGPDLSCAFHNLEAYPVNPFRLCHGLLSAARRRGARLKCGVTVRRIEARAGTPGRIETDRGDFHADRVVVAAGVHTPRLAATLGITLPIAPGRGQVMVTEACPPMLAHPVMFLEYLHIRQTAAGNFYLGSQVENVGWGTAVTLDRLSHFARFYTRVMPVLAHLNILRAFAGMRPVTPDGLPVIGTLPDCPAVVVAAGHGSTGVRYSAGTGRAVSELVLDGLSSQPLEAFDPRRFTHAPAPAGGG